MFQKSKHLEGRTYAKLEQTCMIETDLLQFYSL